MLSEIQELQLADVEAAHESHHGGRFTKKRIHKVELGELSVIDVFSYLKGRNVQIQCRKFCSNLVAAGCWKVTAKISCIL